MTIHQHLGVPKPWERVLELNVPSEQHAARSHCRVEYIVADSRNGPPSDQVPGADLFTVTTHFIVVRVIRAKLHFGPPAEGGSRFAGTPIHIRRVGAAVVEQVELDQFKSLVLQIYEGPVQATAVSLERL